MKYYITADIDREPRTTDKLPTPGRVFVGRVKTVVEAPEGDYAGAIEKGQSIITGSLKPGQTALNFGAMPVDAVEELGDAEIYAGYKTVTLLTYYRVRAGITQRRLADAVGCHIQQIQRLDNGTAPLEGAGAGLVLRIARALGVTVEDLLDA